MKRVAISSLARSRGVGAVCAALVMSVAVQAHADSAAAKAMAVQLFDEAEQLLAAGRIAEACPKYRESNRLDPQLGALLHLADCYERNNQLASAWGHFREAEEVAKKRGDDRELLARERASKLEPRLNRLTLIVAPSVRVPGLEVTIDGVPYAAALWGNPSAIDAGSHTIAAHAPGHQSWSQPLTIQGEARVAQAQVPALLQAPGSATLSLAGSSQNAGPIDPRSRMLRTIGWVTAGVGAVGLGLGVAFLVKRNNKLDEREKVCGSTYTCTTQEDVVRIENLTDEARSADTLAKVSLIAGGVLLAGGVTTALLAPTFTPRESQRTGAWISPSVSPGTAMLHAGSSF